MLIYVAPTDYIWNLLSFARIHMLRLNLLQHPWLRLEQPPRTVHLLHLYTPFTSLLPASDNARVVGIVMSLSCPILLFYPMFCLVISRHVVLVTWLMNFVLLMRCWMICVIINSLLGSYIPRLHHYFLPRTVCVLWPLSCHCLVLSWSILLFWLALSCHDVLFAWWANVVLPMLLGMKMWVFINNLLGSYTFRLHHYFPPRTVRMLWAVLSLFCHVLSYPIVMSCLILSCCAYDTTDKFVCCCF
jgi:hypothetical protein